VIFLLRVKLTPIKTVSSPSPTKVWSTPRVLQLTTMEYRGVVPVLIIEVNMSTVDGATVSKLVQQVVRQYQDQIQENYVYFLSSGVELSTENAPLTPTTVCSGAPHTWII